MLLLLLGLHIADSNPVEPYHSIYIPSCDQLCS